MGNLLPEVYETKGKIERFAKIKNKKLVDFHQYEDGKLCLIRSDEYEKWYPHGLELHRLMDNIVTHLYWVSYFYRYDKEPWPSQPHGGAYFPI